MQLELQLLKQNLINYISNYSIKEEKSSMASGESTTTECGFNYQLLAVIYWSSPMDNS